MRTNILERLSYYFKVWLTMAKNSLLNWSANRRVLFTFLAGKVIRYIAYFGFLYLLVSGTGGILNYSKEQTLFFTATYVLIDVTAQFFFRSVYSFRRLVVTGDFDLILVKPSNALFRVLLGGPDPIDLITLPPIILIVVWVGSLLGPSLSEIILYTILVFNGLVVAASFHIFVLAFGVISLEVDHLIHLYRDLTSMGRFPVDIYRKPLKSILTFTIPVGVMITIPAKAISGLVGVYGVISSLIVGVIFLFASVKFWNFALKRYTSASS